MNLKNELLDHQKEFYREALTLADKDPVKAYIFGNESNKLQAQYFANLLRQHHIEVYSNSREITKNGKKFNPETSFVVPLKQKQYRMIKALFNEVNTFTDSTFYDVSTWNFPYSFNVAFAEISSLKEIQYSKVAISFQSEGKLIGGRSNIGYLFQWNEYTSPKALYELQKAGLLTKVATKEFSFVINGELKDFGYGTILIPANDQRLDENQIFNLAERIAKETGIDFYGLSTGLSPKGIDLGSSSFVNLIKPEILLFVGGSSSSADAGEIWHLFDQRYNIPVTLVETTNLGSIELSKYNTIILPGGTFREWNSTDVQKLKTWAQEGGIIIANESAVSWAVKNEIGKTTFKKTEQTDSTLYLSYEDREKERSLNSISGAIFNTALDITHPLCYGYTENTLPLFKTGTSVVKPLDIKYAEPVKFTAEPFLSGFVSGKNLELIKNAPVVSVQTIGKGKLISYHESMTFRGIWLGTNKLFANGVFFGKIIQ
jgi:hypothetical protein